MDRRVLVSVAAATLVAAATPSAALGGTVSLVGDRLSFTAFSGETNHVRVTRTDGQLMVTENGMASHGEADPDCTSDSGPPQLVSCPAAGIMHLELSGGNLDDELTNTTGLPAQAYGEDGNDFMLGGGGDERLEGGPGTDRINGGGGIDRLYAATFQDPGAGADSDQLAGGPGDDRLFGGGGANGLDGGPGADQLEGAAGADDLRGGDGPDGLIGGDGDDVEDGGAGDDAVGAEITLGVVETSQERGDDVLLGGEGNDTLAPGPGPPLPDATPSAEGTAPMRSATARV